MSTCFLIPIASAYGTRGFTEGAVKDLSITVDRNRVFVAYLERDMLDRVTVKMFDGSAWITVGSRGFSNNNSSCPSVAISQGVPFIAFSDGGLSGKLNVLKLQ